MTVEKREVYQVKVKQAVTSEQLELGWGTNSLLVPGLSNQE